MPNQSRKKHEKQYLILKPFRKPVLKQSKKEKEKR